MIFDAVAMAEFSVLNLLLEKKMGSLKGTIEIYEANYPPRLGNMTKEVHDKLTRDYIDDMFFWIESIENCIARAEQLNITPEQLALLQDRPIQVRRIMSALELVHPKQQDIIRRHGKEAFLFLSETNEKEVEEFLDTMPIISEKWNYYYSDHGATFWKYMRDTIHNVVDGLSEQHVYRYEPDYDVDPLLLGGQKSSAYYIWVKEDPSNVIASRVIILEIWEKDLKHGDEEGEAVEESDAVDETEAEKRETDGDE